MSAEGRRVKALRLLAERAVTIRCSVRGLVPQQRESLLDEAEREGLTANELSKRARGLCADLSLPGKEGDADCEAVLDELVLKARRELAACGYESDVVLELSVGAPGIEYRVTSGGAR